MVVSTKVVAISTMSQKLATLGLFKRKIFSNNVCNVIIFVLDVTNKISSRDSNYIADVTV